MRQSKYSIDTSTRMCECGHYRNEVSGKSYLGVCVDTCYKTYTMLDYPPGYFAYKYQVQKNDAVGMCPACELDCISMLPDLYADYIQLLLTHEIQNEEQKENAIKVYGKELLAIINQAKEYNRRNA